MRYGCSVTPSRKAKLAYLGHSGLNVFDQVLWHILNIKESFLYVKSYLARVVRVAVADNSHLGSNVYIREV